MLTSFPFVFAACREGSEPSLKADVARRHGDLLTPAFMRPQLITWKAKKPLPAGFELDSPFARVSGFSLGPVKSAADIVSRLREQNITRVALNVSPRLVPENGETDWKALDEAESALKRDLTAAGLQIADSAKDGEIVLEVILEPEADKPLFAGVHEQRGGLCTRLPRVTLPTHAPSRAWLKAEQGLAWRGWAAEDLRGRVALDLGCAPGGASLALLDRGMRVTGVDTGDMDEAVLRHDSGGFRHLRVPLAHLDVMKLPASVDLMLCDINLAPPEVLPHLARLQQTLNVPRMLLTLKMNTPVFEKRIDEFLTYIRGFAPAPVHVTQLPANRREVCIAAG